MPSCYQSDKGQCAAVCQPGPQPQMFPTCTFGCNAWRAAARMLMHLELDSSAPPPT